MLVKKTLSVTQRSQVVMLESAEYFFPTEGAGFETWSYNFSAVEKVREVELAATSALCINMA